MRYIIKLVCLLALLTINPQLNAAPSKIALLGKIELNRYVAPEDIFSVTMPFEKYDPAIHLVRDILLTDSLNVLFEDTGKNVRYRVELSDLHDPGKLDERIQDRLDSYKGLVRRAYHDGLLPIYVGDLPGNGKAFYYHQGEKPTRYHLFYFKTKANRLVMVWVDFLESDVTPDVEDKVIDGSNPVVSSALQLLDSIK